MRAAKYLALFVVALVLTGIIYEQIGERRDRKKYKQIGRSVDIGGRSLNIYCSGDGKPTVIFEGAGHTAGYAWIDIQAEVSKFTRACWYDRAGYGWSDPDPSTRTFQSIANDLHALLKAPALPGPYVLVGATAGTFHIRVYNGLYPTEVAGAVLIHASDPDAFAHEPEYMKGALGSLPPLLQRIGCVVGRGLYLGEEYGGGVCSRRFWHSSAVRTCGCKTVPGARSQIPESYRGVERLLVSSTPAAFSRTLLARPSHC